MSLMSRACFATTVFAAVLASTTFAQPPERGRGGERGRAGERGRGDERGGFEGRRGGAPPEALARMMPVLAALDADHDGKISTAEIDNATAALKSLDKNSDGQLTFEEMRPGYAAVAGRGGSPRGFDGSTGGAPPRGGDGPARGNPREMVDRIMQSDKNNDGKLTKDELVQGMENLFRRADANSDGVATREELEVMASQGMGRDGNRRGPEGRGPGGPEGRDGDRRGPEGRGPEGRGPEGRGPDGRGPEGRGPEGRRGPGGPEFFSRMFEERDANKDGKLSGDEIPEPIAQRLEQIDTDKDGSVSRAEMTTMASRMRERGGRDGAGRGGPDGGGQPGGDRPRRPEAE